MASPVQGLSLQGLLIQQETDTEKHSQSVSHNRGTQHTLPCEALTMNNSIQQPGKWRLGGDNLHLGDSGGWAGQGGQAGLPRRTFTQKQMLSSRAAHDVRKGLRWGSSSHPLLAPAGSWILSSSSSQFCPLTTQPSRGRTRTSWSPLGRSTAQHRAGAQETPVKSTCAS